MLADGRGPATIPREVAILWWSRTAMSGSRALAGILVPLYLAVEGFSGLELGALWMVVGLTSAGISAIVGFGSDRLGRRPFLVALPLVTAGSAAVFSYSSSTAVLFVAAAAGSFGRGAGAGAGMIGPYQPAEAAMVSEATPPRLRNAAFGRLGFGSSLGALLGGLAATAVSAGDRHGAAAAAAYRPGFLTAGVLAAVAGLLALWLHEPPRARTDRAAGRGLSFPRRSLPLLVRLWVTNGTNGLAVGMFGPFITYWFFRRYGAGPAEIGLLFAVINAVTAPAPLLAARLARRWGLIRTLSVARGVQAVLLVPMVLSPVFPLAGAVYLVRMAVQRVGLPLRQSYVLAMAHPEERGSVGALSSLPAQISMTAGPMFSGYLFDEVSLALPFELAAVLQAVDAALYWTFFHDLHPSEELEQGKSVPDVPVPGESGED